MADIDKKATQWSLIVTGAGRGIGAAAAKLAGARGYRMAVKFPQDAQSAAEVVRHIAASGGSATAIQADISREREVVRFFEAAERELSPLTGLATLAVGVLHYGSNSCSNDSERRSRSRSVVATSNQPSQRPRRRVEPERLLDAPNSKR